MKNMDIVTNTIGITVAGAVIAVGARGADASVAMERVVSIVATRPKRNKLPNWNNTSAS
jgi:hypothetical protein